MDLSSLASSLSTSTKLTRAEKELMEKFRAAALSITTLYKSSLHTSKRAYSAGYSACLADVLQMIQNGLSAQHSADGMENVMTIGRVMDWVEARQETIRLEDEDDGDDSGGDGAESAGSNGGGRRRDPSRESHSGGRERMAPPPPPSSSSTPQPAASRRTGAPAPTGTRSVRFEPPTSTSTVEGTVDLSQQQQSQSQSSAPPSTERQSFPQNHLPRLVPSSIIPSSPASSPSTPSHHPATTSNSLVSSPLVPRRKPPPQPTASSSTSSSSSFPTPSNPKAPSFLLPEASTSKIPPLDSLPSSTIYPSPPSRSTFTFGVSPELQTSFVSTSTSPISPSGLFSRPNPIYHHAPGSIITEREPTGSKRRFAHLLASSTSASPGGEGSTSVGGDELGEGTSVATVGGGAGGGSGGRKKGRKAGRGMSSGGGGGGGRNDGAGGGGGGGGSQGGEEDGGERDKKRVSRR